MGNTETLDRIAAAIANTETQLGALDACNQAVATSQETAVSLSADVAAILRNDAKLETKVRIAKLTAANSALAITQSDLKLLLDEESAQKAKTLRVGEAAAAALLTVRDLLRIRRQENAKTWVSAQFDFAQIPVVRPQDLANAHQSVREIRDLKVSALHFQLQHDDDFTISTLRGLAQVFAELRPLALAEQGLDLGTITAEPKEAPVVKPEPAPATLSAAVVA